MANENDTIMQVQEGADVDAEVLSLEQLLEQETRSHEAENERLRKEIQALESELAQPFEEDERVKKGSKRLRQIELTLADVEATLSVMAEGRPSPRNDPLYTRSENAMAEDAYEHLAETVKELEEAVARAETRKSEEGDMLERDATYLLDNDIIRDQLQRRISVGADLPSPDGREIIFRAKQRLDELHHRFSLLDSGLGALIEVLADDTQDAIFDPQRLLEEKTNADSSLEGVSSSDIRRFLRANDIDATAGRAEASQERVDKFKGLLEALATRSMENTAGQFSPTAAATNGAGDDGSGFFAVSVPDELVDFVVRSEIAEEAQRPELDQKANGGSSKMPADTDNSEEAAKGLRRIRLVEVGVRIDV